MLRTTAASRLNITKPIQENIPDVLTILEKMPGIYMQSPILSQEPIDMMIEREQDETPEDFEFRKILTLRLASMQDYQLSNVTCLVLGHIMMKKAKLGIIYEQQVETAVAYVMDLLQQGY